MNAFGEALNLVFMRRSGGFSSGSYSQPMNLRMHSHEFLFEVNESQNAFPWVPIPSQWISDCNLEFLFEVNESQTAILSSGSYSLPMEWISDCNLEFWFLFPANGLNLRMQPWVPISLPMEWISDCIPWVPISLPNFWSLLAGYTHVLPSWFRNAHRRSKSCILTRFWGYPLPIHMGTPKIDCRAF